MQNFSYSANETCSILKPYLFIIKRLTIYLTLYLLGFDLSGWCPRGGVWPEPPEDLPPADQAGPQAEARAPVHHCPQGDLHTQVQPAQTGIVLQTNWLTNI